jgi:hypothetical protein
MGSGFQARQQGADEVVEIIINLKELINSEVVKKQG